MNISAPSKPPQRCAVYCRVSSDERLAQEFNSIDAQKEAGQAYIVSQRTEGWLAVADDYDDPGFSGGNIERPGLKRLLADIQLGKIDIVVVYKIDRLTRSLADFSKMVEVFEAHGVSFVSVTQQFNTTTSMGRLMLNVLLSFAQFEREVTGERIRDKIAASKRRGLWMGGVPPLGYDVDQRQLVINAAEAAVVQRVFSEMLTIGSPTRIAQILSDEGISTKVWTTQKGLTRQGARIDKKYLYKLLRNRIYLGELSHKGQWFPAAHPAIISIELWEQVHAVLANHAHDRSVLSKTRSRNDVLLRGLLFNAAGDPMYSTYTLKKGKAYFYYISKSEIRFGTEGKTCERIAANGIEAATIAQIKSVLASPESIAAVCQHIQKNGTPLDEASAVLGMMRLGDVWEQLFPAERHRIVQLMIQRIDLVADGLQVQWHELGWQGLIGEFAAGSIGAELLEQEAA
ncbi:recombinase family protein [Iodobacter arcticus]|uniref:Recombinase family protein n=1 Tax=Iodobacter arcticus TaxID=590593 RepID=A0ABW2R457_9NEIS